MNAETPLAEVAAMLPSSAATLLLASPSAVQEWALTNIRSCMTYWESDGYQLDPITMEGVLNAFVISLVGTLGALHDARLEIMALKSILRMFDPVDGGPHAP